jgi:hypothetical protein
MWAHAIVVSAPILQLFDRIRKRQEPVRGQAFCPEAAVEGFDVGKRGRYGGSLRRLGGIGSNGLACELTGSASISAARCHCRHWLHIISRQVLRYFGVGGEELSLPA